MKIQFKLFLMVVILCMDATSKGQQPAHPTYYHVCFIQDTTQHVLIKGASFHLMGKLKSGKKFDYQGIVQVDSAGILFDFNERLEFNQVASFRFRPHPKNRSKVIGGYYLAMASLGLGIAWNTSYSEGYGSSLPLAMYFATSIIWATLPPIIISAAMTQPFVTDKEVLLESIQPIDKP